MRPIVNLTSLSNKRAQSVLFERLFDFMAADTPHVPLTPAAAGLVANMRDKILAGGVQEYPTGLGSQLLAGIRWEDRSAGGGPFCGAGALQFLSHVGEAVQRFGPVEVPLHIALLALMHCQYEPSALDRTGDEDGWRLYVTSFGSAALGVYGESAITERVPLTDTAHELFESHYVGTLGREAAGTVAASKGKRGTRSVRRACAGEERVTSEEVARRS